MLMTSATRYPLMSDVVRLMGFRLPNDGNYMPMGASAGRIGQPCQVNVVINGMEHQSINDVSPSNVGAIATGSGPSEYQGRCGVILIWTRR